MLQARRGNFGFTPVTGLRYSGGMDKIQTTKSYEIRCRSPAQRRSFAAILLAGMSGTSRRNP